MASTRLPLLSIDAGWRGSVHVAGGGRQWWVLAIGHAPAREGRPAVTFTRRVRRGEGGHALPPPDTVDGLRIAHNGLWVAAASGGHPASRIVLPDGSIQPLEAHGLVLGIDGGQEYVESHAELPLGASLVLYTDGVIEARRGGELYGDDRLDALLAERHELPARALAAAVAEDARDFAGGDLSDDLAVVVIRKT